MSRPDLDAAPARLGLCPLVVRILLGGIFIAAAYFKIRDPQTFAEAIQAFKMVQSDWLVLFGTHALPWIEMFAGTALVVGFWSRAAAFVIGGLLTVFIYALISAIQRGLGGTPCSCFGEYYLICKEGVGWCKVVENSVLLFMALAILVDGGGAVSVDRLMASRASADQD